MRVGLDYRPALQNREGIGRYARELVRGFVELGFDGDLGLFGYTAAPMRFTREELGLAGTRAELVRLRVPSRWLPWLLKKLGKGVDDLVGGADVYHHTQPNLLRVRRAAEVSTIFDCIFMLPDSGYLDPAVAARMTKAAREQVKRSKRVLVPSEYVGAEVVMALGAHPARVSVVKEPRVTVESSAPIHEEKRTIVTPVHITFEIRTLEGDRAAAAIQREHETIEAIVERAISRSPGYRAMIRGDRV